MENEHLGVEIMTQNQSEGKVEQSVCEDPV